MLSEYFSHGSLRFPGGFLTRGNIDSAPEYCMAPRPRLCRKLHELAGQLSSLGASIFKDFDADGNPVIVVDGLPEGQIFDTLQAFGVAF